MWSISASGLVHARLRLDRRDGVRRPGGRSAGTPFPQAGPALVPPAALPRAQARAGGPQPAAAGRPRIGDRGRGRPPPGRGRLAPPSPPDGADPSRSRVRRRGAVRAVRAARLALGDHAAGHGRPGQPHLEARGARTVARGRRRGRHADRGRRASLPPGVLEPDAAGGAHPPARRRDSPRPPGGCRRVPRRGLRHRRGTGLRRTSAPSPTSGPTWRRRSPNSRTTSASTASPSSFRANAADLELKVLAFNLLVLSQRPALGCASLQHAKPLRRRLLAIAGRLIRTAGQWRLQLARDWAGQVELARVRHHLATIGP